MSQSSQKNTFVRVTFFTQSLKNFIQKRPWHWYFPVNFVEFLRTSFLQNTYGRLPLFLVKPITWRPTGSVLVNIGSYFLLNN